STGARGTGAAVTGARTTVGVSVAAAGAAPRVTRVRTSWPAVTYDSSMRLPAPARARSADNWLGESTASPLTAMMTASIGISICVAGEPGTRATTRAPLA